MGYEIFPLTLKTFNTIFNSKESCKDDDNEIFYLGKFGNNIRNKIYYLGNNHIVSDKCFSVDNCSISLVEDLAAQKQKCDIFNLLDKGENYLKMQAYVAKVNDTIFRSVNTIKNNERIFGSDYKIFSPQHTPLLYEHECVINKKININYVHDCVVKDIDVFSQSLKTGKCGIYLIESMPNRLINALKEITSDLVNKTTSDIIEFLSTPIPKSTELNYTYNYIPNSTNTRSYDTNDSQDHSILYTSLIAASAITFCASMTYLLTNVYKKYCKKVTIEQPETPDSNISDPDLMTINGKKAVIYYSDSSSADEPVYAIVDISSKKVKYGISNVPTSSSDDYERIELISSDDNPTQDNINVNADSLARSDKEENKCIQIQGNAEPQVIINISQEESKVAMYDYYGPDYDYPPPPRPVIQDSDSGILVQQYYNGCTVLGVTEEIESFPLGRAYASCMDLP